MTPRLQAADALPPALRGIDHAFPDVAAVAPPLRELARRIDRQRA